MHVNKSNKMNPEKYKRADPRFAVFHTKLFIFIFQNVFSEMKISLGRGGGYYRFIWLSPPLSTQRIYWPSLACMCTKGGPTAH